MRILVTRAEEDAERTARKLAGLGHEALIAPLIHIVPTQDPAPEGPYDALIVTSAHAVEAASSLGEKGRTVFAVGERTAEALREAGFLKIHTAEGDAVSLVRLIRESLPSGLTLIHVTGRHHKEEPALSLKEAGFRVLSWEAYEAGALEGLPEAAVAALLSGQIDAALHYSHRSADLFIRAADKAGLTSCLRICPHLCLSADVAAPLEAVGASVLVAGDPSENALLALLGTLP